MLKSIQEFIKYWYFRYLVVTELYMVEKWERAMFHIVLFLVLSVLYIFNTTVVVGLVRTATGWIFMRDVMKIDDDIINEPIKNL
ncbi:unnamed protein product [Phyllotreta striolata]|uniref:Serine palmitoyltransferase small subunit A n=1 Tax=Phyllotreta striolata TaxID=444603 RepID=A0A9N9THW3_PHYSR|nr:unnamed protein product [Phyllotreta striolata]